MSSVSAKQLRESARELSIDPPDRSSPQKLWCLALIKLADKSPANAVDLLRVAVSKASSDARIHNDLAVAYMALASLESNPYYMILAESAVARAIKLDPFLEEPKFNHALIMGNLHLQAQSQAGWKRYIAEYKKSLWASEARQRLANYPRQTWSQVQNLIIKELQSVGPASQLLPLRGFEQPARLWIEDEILLIWASAELQGDVMSASRYAEIARQVSASLKDLTGDSLLFDSVVMLDESGAAKRKTLISAHNLYGRAMLLYKNRHLREALVLFGEAEYYFRQAESPFENWATFFSVVCRYKDGEIEGSLVALDKLRKRRSGHKSLNLQGRINWVEGLIHLERADPSKALKLFMQARENFSKVHERAHEGAVSSLAAICLDYMGKQFEAWRFHHLALSAVSESQDASLIPVVYSTAARALLARGQGEAALSFQSEVFYLALSSMNPVTVTEAFWWRAMVHEKIGNFEQARKDIIHAKTLCSKIPHEATRQRTLAGILVMEGVIERAFSPDRSIVLFDRALGIYGVSDYSYLLVDILRERAKAYLATGRDVEAERDLGAAAEECERQRQKIGSQDFKRSYLSRSRSIFDDLVLFQLVRRQDSSRAFGFVEQGRARVLLDSLGCQGGDNMGVCAAYSASLLEVSRAVPLKSSIVEYYILADRILIWVISAKNARLREVFVSRSEIELLVEEFVAGMRDSSVDASFRASENLFQILIGPIQADLAGQERLIVVPDGPLSRIPFSALRDSGSGRYLTELFDTLVEPSASSYLTMLRRFEDRRLSQSPIKTSLVVAPPAGTASSGLSSLPSAEIEAKALAKRNPGSVLLINETATVENFVNKINEHDLVHFAGHALIGQFGLGKSSLVFSSARGVERLPAASIAKLRLSMPKLVVLAACSTGEGSGDAEGVSDLARAFLSAGVPLVVVSSWPIEDKSSSLFWNAFYDHFLRNGDPVKSLRHAQLVLLKSKETHTKHPRAWAGFQAVGVG